MSEARTALVTGASRGIGAAIADALRVAGYQVAGTATGEAGARAIDERLGEQGMGLVMDVADDDSVISGLDRIGEQLGAPLILVNNAGINRDNLLARMKPEQWSQVINTNLGGVYRLCQQALRPMMKARFGRIISLGSVVARLGNPGQVSYAASKAAIEGFSRSLAREVGSRGITVNVVAPGFIETQMTDSIAEQKREQLLAQVAAGRLGRSEEVAAAVVYLASDGASYVTGETLHVNGGLYMA